MRAEEKARIATEKAKAKGKDAKPLFGNPAGARNLEKPRSVSPKLQNPRRAASPADKARSPSPGVRPSDDGGPVITAEKIARCQSVLLALVNAVREHHQSQDIEEPLALQAEGIISTVAKKTAELHQVCRKTMDTANCREPDVCQQALEEIPKVELLRHDARRWAWALEDMRRKKILTALEKEKVMLQDSHDALKSQRFALLAKRREVARQLKLNSQVKVKWKSAESNALKHLHALESSFEFVADHNGRKDALSPRKLEDCNSRRNLHSRNGQSSSPPRLRSPAHPPAVCNAHPNQDANMIQTVRGMKVACAQSERANRELATMLISEKRYRKKVLASIGETLQAVAKQRRLQGDIGVSTSTTAGANRNQAEAAWCGPKPDELVVYRATTRTLMGADSAIGVEFLKHTAASSGMFPLEFLDGVPPEKQSTCVELLRHESVRYGLRTRGLERIFQVLQEIRFFNDVDKAVAYIVDMLCCCLRCDRASFWIIDNERGFAWTKFAAGGKELCVPINTGLVGAAVTSEAVVHVKDAYTDERFNPASDLSSGFRTKSVLCVPILQTKCAVEKSDTPARTGRKRKDEEGGGTPNKGVLAVVQVVNKTGGTGYFDDTDIFMLTTLGYGMTAVVLNCEQEQLDLQTNFRRNILLSGTWEMSLNCHSPVDLIRILKKYMRKLFKGIDASLTLAYNDHMKRLDIDPVTNTLIEIESPKGVGLVGACIHSRDRIHARDVSLDARYDPKIDLNIVTPDEDKQRGKVRRGDFSAHCLPLKRGGLLSAVVQWICEQRSRVDFGDDGLFNENNPRHIDLVGRMMVNVQGLVEQWFPTMDRLQTKRATIRGQEEKKK